MRYLQPPASACWHTSPFWPAATQQGRFVPAQSALVTHVVSHVAVPAVVFLKHVRFEAHATGTAQVAPCGSVAAHFLSVVHQSVGRQLKLPLQGSPSPWMLGFSHVQGDRASLQTRPGLQNEGPRREVELHSSPSLPRELQLMTATMSPAMPGGARKPVRMTLSLSLVLWAQGDAPSSGPVVAPKGEAAFRADAAGAPVHRH
jgi:hypothetical protein